MNGWRPKLTAGMGSSIFKLKPHGTQLKELHPQRLAQAGNQTRVNLNGFLLN